MNLTNPINSSQSPPDESNWRQFSLAATKPSGPAAVMTLIVLMIWFAVANILTHPRVMLAMFSDGALMVDRDDDVPYATRKTWQLAADGTESFTVLILGASDSRECIQSRQRMGEALAEVVGEPVRIEMLYLDHAECFDLTLMMDQLHQGLRGVVVLGINQVMASRTTSELQAMIDLHRLPLRSALVRADVESHGIHFPAEPIWPLIRDQPFIVRRLYVAADRLYHGPLTHQRIRSMTYPQWNLEPIRLGHDHGFGLLQKYKSSPKRVEMNVDLAVRGAKRLRDRSPSLQLAIMRPPLNPWLLESPQLEQAIHRFDKLLHQIAADHQLPLINPAGHAQLTPEDFADSVHLVTEAGRNRFQNALTKDLTELLSKRRKQ